MHSVLMLLIVHKKDGILEATFKLSSKTGDMCLVNSGDYKFMRRKTSRSVREDRQKYRTEFSGLLEYDANRRDLHQPYRMIGRASRKQVSCCTILHDSAGTLITDNEGRLKRCQEHVSDLLNTPRRSIQILLTATKLQHSVNSTERRDRWYSQTTEKLQNVR